MKATLTRLTLACVNLILIIIFTGVFIEYSYALQDDHLIGAWLFDEGEGNVAKDTSGRGHDGEFKGEPAPAWIDGKFGKALEFKSGTGSVVVPPSEDLDNLTAITISSSEALPALSQYH